MEWTARRLQTIKDILTKANENEWIPQTWAK